MAYLNRDKERQTCKHYTGQHGGGPCCRAGVNYVNLAASQEDGWALRLPCNAYMIETARKKGVTQATCPKRETPTEAELDAEEADIAAAIARHEKAQGALNEIRRAHKGRSARGTIPCPACGTGTIDWSIAGYNGHMRVRCSTPDCLNWVE